MNAVVPGAVITKIEAPMNSELAASGVGAIFQAVMPAPTQAAQLAVAITCLASDESDNTTGVILPSDGGWSTI